MYEDNTRNQLTMILVSIKKYRDILIHEELYPPATKVAKAVHPPNIFAGGFFFLLSSSPRGHFSLFLINRYLKGGRKSPFFGPKLLHNLCPCKI